MMQRQLFAAALLALASGPALAAPSERVLIEGNPQNGALVLGGNIEWTIEKDAGGPVLVAHADVPGRQLGVEVRFRRNTDTSLPATHIVEIDFRVPDGFGGGSIAQLPGILAADSASAEGAPLIGASVRVVGNSFLFAMSSAPNDARNNAALLTDNKWIELALVYKTGKQAKLVLEKDAEAAKLFDQMFR
jgi:hypothetical protein